MSSEVNKKSIERYAVIGLVTLLLILALMPVAVINWYASTQVDRELVADTGYVDRLFRIELENESRVMTSLIDGLEKNPCIREAYRAKDRRRLQQCAEPLLKSMRSAYRVTHFYFHDLEERVFLRVHHPGRHGDLIDRVTLTKAAESGKLYSGIELGTFGTFTLRVVQPWLIDGELVGYIELGEEIDHITPRLKQILDVDLMLVIDKLHTNRGKWEEGQKMMGRPGDWDEYPGVVVIDRTLYIWDDELQSLAQHHHDHVPMAGIDFEVNDRHYHANGLPLMDAGKRHVGHIIVLADATTEYDHIRSFSLMLLAVVAVIVALLLFLARFYISRIGSRLTVTSDGVRQGEQTELLEKQQQALQREVQRYQRALREEQLCNAHLALALQPTSLDDYLNTALKQLVDAITWLDHLPEGVLFLSRERDGEQVLELAASFNFSPQLQQKCALVEMGTCLCGKAAADGEVIFCDHVDERHVTAYDEMHDHGHYVIPMINDGDLIGVFTIYLPAGTVHDERDESFLKRIAEIFTHGVLLRRGGCLQHLSSAKEEPSYE